MNLVDTEGHSCHVGPHEVCGADLCIFTLEPRKVHVEVELQRIILGILVLFHCKIKLIRLIW